MDGTVSTNYIPFGITSAPEHFQRRMGEILNNLPVVVCHVDDVSVSGNDQKERDNRLHAVLKKIQAAGITLNKEKCQFSRPRITFLAIS